MRRLDQMLPERLACIGIHSPKFPSERETRNLALAVERMDIRHPVVNDADMRVWDSYAVRAWPTLCLIDPEGFVVGMHVGEFDAHALGALVEQLTPEYRERGTLAPTSSARTRATVAARTGLAFPSKLAVKGDTLWIADTARHRVLELALSSTRTARVARSFGGARAGFADGGADLGLLSEPRGLAVGGGTLYVADTGNHAVRAIDLTTGELRTLAGDGRLGSGGADTGDTGEARAPHERSLRSPWDVALADDGRLFVAMAGEHRIWAGLPEALVPFAGNGREALVDGALQAASFNQPSGLALAGERLWVADSEASAVREIDLAARSVRTLVGRGLFEFGDVDGRGEEVRLQHPTGLASDGATVWIADTFNDRVKELELASGRVRSRVGIGRSGHKDGAFARARFHEPQGLALGGGVLWVADTNNHRVRRVDLAAGRVSTLTIEGLD